MGRLNEGLHPFVHAYHAALHRSCKEKSRYACDDPMAISGSAAAYWLAFVERLR